MNPPWRIPLFDVSPGEEEIEALNAVLRSGWLSMGENVIRFEEAFAARAGAAFAVSMSSGTAALHVAHMLAGVGPGDEVVCPSLTFVAGPNVVRALGATPVFADIHDPLRPVLTAAEVGKRLTPKTRAIQVVHYAGYACDIEAIAELARERGLALIEDCAHALFTVVNGRACGRFGLAGCFSFFPNKNMTTAEGGMLLTDDPLAARRAKALRSHGMTAQTLDRHKGHCFSYDVTEPGLNYRMDELRAALGLVQLAKLDRANRRREQLCSLYRDALQTCPDVSVPFERGEPSAHHIFPVLLPPSADRGAFMAFMKERGIQTSIHYPPAHLFTGYRPGSGLSGPDLPATQDFGAREVTLPLYPGMADGDVADVADAVRAFITRSGR